MNIKYKIDHTKQIERDLKRMLRRGKDINRFHRVLNDLASGKALAKKFRDHQLSGKWQGCRDCHIEDDWILIYRIDKDKLTLVTMRTGTHSDLEL